MAITPRQRYYEVLEVSSCASQEEIKSSYRRLAKLYHPDKMNNLTSKLPSSANRQESFHALEEAYRILSNESSRKTYDEAEAATRKSHPIAAYLSRDDLDPADEPPGMCYPCRCGDVFFVSHEKLDTFCTQELVVPCSSCSFAVVVRL